MHVCGDSTHKLPVCCLLRCVRRMLHSEQRDICSLHRVVKRVSKVIRYHEGLQPCWPLLGHGFDSLGRRHQPPVHRVPRGDPRRLLLSSGKASLTGGHDCQSKASQGSLRAPRQAPTRYHFIYKAESNFCMYPVFSETTDSILKLDGSSDLSHDGPYSLMGDIIVDLDLNPSTRHQKV